MACAESKQIIGFLPIEERHYPAILSLVAPATSAVRLHDPFAGEGAFLKAAAKAWNVTPYANELDTSEAQAVAKLKHHIMQLVNIPVFVAWSAYLYEAGQRAMLVRKTRSAGGIDLLSVDLDVDAWTRLITGGLEQKHIKIDP